jgi:hypothetical protein
MHTKYPPIHNSAQREVIKHIAAVPPHVPAAILALTLVVEPIHLCDLARFVVAADEGDAIWVSNFEEE